MRRISRHSAVEKDLVSLRPRRRSYPMTNDGESGAVLVLALVFMIIVAGVVTALLDWSQNNLNNVAHFKSARSLQYALSGATQVAMQTVRYEFTPTTPSPANPPICSNTVPVTIDGNQVEVWCSATWTPTSVSTRVVTFSACTEATTVNDVLTPVVPAPTGATCAASPALQAVVTFDDYSASNPLVNPSPCTSTCGSSMTINAWKVASEEQ
jgi:hypothetical protein